MNKYVGPLYNPYRIYYSQQSAYSYGYPQIHFEHIESTVKNNNENNTIDFIDKKLSTEQNNRNSKNSQRTNFSFNDIISLDNDRINVLGFSINIDDLILLVTLFTMFKNSEEIDYILVIVLGLLLFSQD